MAEGEAGPLDEAAHVVGGNGALIGVVEAIHLIGPQRAVGRLRAAVEAKIDSATGRVMAGAAIVRTASPLIYRLPVAERVVVVVALDRGAKPDAGLRAGQIEEPVTVETADLDVFDRLGLHRHIGCLRPNDRNYTRCGAEEKTFHHPHLNLRVPLSWAGSVSGRVRRTP